jgi:hypothetical protein
VLLSGAVYYHMRRIKLDPDLKTMTGVELQQEVMRLRSAFRKELNHTGNHRCWINLLEALPEGRRIRPIDIPEDPKFIRALSASGNTLGLQPRIGSSTLPGSTNIPGYASGEDRSHLSDRKGSRSYGQLGPTKRGKSGSTPGPGAQPRSKKMKKTTPELPSPPDVIEFQVHDIHIQAGQRWNVASGPLTKAILDHFLDQKHKVQNVQVGYLLAYINGYEYTLDEETKAWMNAFLHREPVKPFRARLKKGRPDIASAFNSKAKPAYTHI